MTAAQRAPSINFRVFMFDGLVGYWLKNIFFGAFMQCPAAKIRTNRTRGVYDLPKKVDF
jgi:hypothetical protein